MPDWVIGILGALVPLLLLNAFVVVLNWREHRKILRESQEAINSLWRQAEQGRRPSGRASDISSQR